MSSSATHFSPKATRTTFPTATHTATVHGKSIRFTATINTIESSPRPSPSSQNADRSTVTRPSTTHEAETSSSTRETTSPRATTTNHRDGGGKDGDGDKGNSSKTTSSPAATTTKTTASHHGKHGGGEHGSTRLRSKSPPIAMSSPTAPSLLASLGTSIPPLSPKPDRSEPAPTPQPLESGGDLNDECSTVTPSGHGKGKDNNLGVSEGKPTTITTVVSATPTTETFTMGTKMGSSSVETLEITTSFGGHTLTMTENPTSTSSSDGDRSDFSGKNHLGAIFGGTVATVIVSAVVFWLCMILRRRRRQKQERDPTISQGISHLDIGVPRSPPLSAMVLQFPPSTLHRKPVHQLVDVLIPDLILPHFNAPNASPFKDPAYSGGDMDTIPDSYHIPTSRDNPFENSVYSDRDDSSLSMRSVHSTHALSVVEEESEPDSRTSSTNSIPLVC